MSTFFTAACLVSLLTFSGWAAIAYLFPSDHSPD